VDEVVAAEVAVLPLPRRQSRQLSRRWMPRYRIFRRIPLLRLPLLLAAAVVVDEVVADAAVEEATTRLPLRRPPC